MRRRLARLGVVVGVSIGLVTLIPALTPSAFAEECSSASNVLVSATCVNVPGVVTVTSAPTEPKTTGCVQQDCLTVTKAGPAVHKQQPPSPPKTQPPAPKPSKPTVTSPRGAVLGWQLQRMERESSDFYSGSFSKALTFTEGWRNGIYRGPVQPLIEAPAPSSPLWAPLTSPAAFTSFVIGAALLASAITFKRLMLN